MPVKVKICGITNLPDAQVAADAGADALGFVFSEASPRFVTLEKAAEISRQLPPYILKTGVFVDAPADVILRAIRGCGLNLLQFHGNESPDFCLGFGVMSMKAFRIKGPESLEQLKEYRTDAWLLDAYTPGQPGGTGSAFDWSLAAEARGFGRPIFLAGGLNAANVRSAIEQVEPYGVDVSSGVEAAPGRKDHTKVRAFIKAAREAISE